jgi:hypothetical protein
MKLRMEHKTFQAIADELGVTRQAAWQMVQKGLQETLETMKVDADRLRQETLEQIESLLEVYGPKAASGDHRAANLVLRGLSDRAKLYGLVRIPQEPPAPKLMDTDELIHEAKMLGLLPADYKRAVYDSNGAAPTGPPMPTTGGRF